MATSLIQTTDRRKLLTTGLAAGLLAASGMSLALRPSVGGRLRAALPGGSPGDSWDARKGFGLFMAAAGHGAVFENLTEVTADGALKGELATGWTASRDARQWVFDLRAGVTFHDGTPFDAASVVESIDLHRQAGPTGAAWHLVDNIAGVRATSATQVQFTLHRGNADFPYLLSDRHLIIYPAGNIAAAMRDGIGTGLYRVAQFEPGQRFVGWRVKDHYKDGSAGWFDQVEFLAVEGSAERVSLMQAGRVDAVAQIDPIQAEIIENDTNLQLTSTPGNQHISLNLSQISDPSVRQAFKLGISREDALFDGLMGHGHMGHDSPFGPFNQHYDTAAQPFDPERALALLKSAGAAGFGLNLQGLGQFASALESALWPSLSQAGFTKGGDAAVSAKLWSGRPTEDWMLAAQSDLGGNSAEIDQLRSASMAELDHDKRAGLYAELQHRLRSNGAFAIPVFASFLHATSARIQQPVTQGNLWPMDNARFAQRWWMS